MGIGSFLYKIKLVDDHFSSQTTNLCLDVLIPCAIIRSFRGSATSDRLTSGLQLIFLGAGAILMGFVIAFIFVRIFKIDLLTANICYLAIMFSNFGIVGFGMVEQVYGVEGLVYFSMFGIVIRFCHFTIGMMIMQRGCGEGGKTNWLKAIFCPPIIAVAIALLILFFHIELPSVINSTVDLLAACLAPIGMLVLGVILARYPFRTLFSNKIVYLVSFFRLLAIPVATIFILKSLGLHGAMVGVPVLILALPAPSNCTLMAEKFKGNTQFGAQVVFVSTLFSILTIPLVLLISSHVL